MNKDHYSLKEWQIQFLSYILGIEQSFVRSVQPIGSLTKKNCCEIYRRGYSARLVESLGSTYEATWWVLGDEDFLKIAGRFISTHHSKSFDLSDYGKEFPKYLSQNSVSSEIPFLSELARFEWQFKNIFHRAGLIKSGKDLTTGLQESPSAVISLQKSCLLWNSRYSVYDIWKNRSKEISVVSKIVWDAPEFLLVYKLDQKIYIKKLNKFDYTFLRFFEKKSTLENVVHKYIEQFGSPEPDQITNFFSQFGTSDILEIK